MESVSRRVWAICVSVALGFSIALLASSVTAQPHGDASDDTQSTYRARSGVASLGTTWDTEAFVETVRLYTNVHRDIEWPGLLEPETVRYGHDTQQTFTLFRPVQEFREPSFVLLFLHGNGLDGSDKLVPGSDDLIYDNIGKLAASFGGIGINANYRTGEGATARTGAEDLRVVLEWVQENISAYGGDPGTVVLIANSDGATNAATYLFDASLQLESGPGIAAAVLSSGIFGDAAPSLQSLVDNYEGTRVPIALWSAQYDPAAVEIGIAELYAQLCRKYQDCPSFAQLAGHNHVSHVMSLGTVDTSVQDTFIRFYHTVR